MDARVSVDPNQQGLVGGEVDNCSLLLRLLNSDTPRAKDQEIFQNWELPESNVKRDLQKIVNLDGDIDVLIEAKGLAPAVAPQLDTEIMKKENALSEKKMEFMKGIVFNKIKRIETEVQQGADLLREVEELKRYVEDVRGKAMEVRRINALADKSKETDVEEFTTAKQASMMKAALLDSLLTTLIEGPQSSSKSQSPEYQKISDNIPPASVGYKRLRKVGQKEDPTVPEKANQAAGTPLKQRFKQKIIHRGKVEGTDDKK